MKALTLWQPWASLVATRDKTVETRSWETSYRGRLAIHAATRFPRDWHGPYQLARGMGGRRWGNPPCQYALLDFRSTGSGRPALPLPLGFVVATCELVDVVPTHRCAHPNHDEQDYGDLPMKGWDRADSELDDEDTVLVSARNYDLGDFGPGRYAWLLDDIVALDNPVPARGRQQLWEWARAA